MAIVTFPMTIGARYGVRRDMDGELDITVEAEVVRSYDGAPEAAIFETWADTDHGKWEVCLSDKEEERACDKAIQIFLESYR